MFDAVGVATVSAKPCIVLFIVLDDEGGTRVDAWHRKMLVSRDSVGR